MPLVAWIAIGAVSGAACIAPAIWMSARSTRLTVLIAVVAMNAIYVGAALDSPVPVLVGEVVVASAISGLSAWAYRVRSDCIVATVVLHAGVDAAHDVWALAPIPQWYVIACLAFDLTYAVAALAVLRTNR